jgi:hypothetical protein
MMAIYAEAPTQAMSVPMNSLTEMLMGRLARALGPGKSQSVANAIFKTLGITELSTPQDLCDFANHLIPYGGVAEAVGRSLKVMALLRSAVDRPPPVRG